MIGMPVAWTSKTVWGYSDEETPEQWEGMEGARGEAIAAARSEYGLEVPIWIQQGEVSSASRYVPDVETVRDFILERMGEDAYDVCDAADEFPDVTLAAQRELDRLLEPTMAAVDAWAEKHCKVNFWESVGQPERVEPVQNADNGDDGPGAA